jgi:hypothetical protein
VVVLRPADLRLGPDGQVEGIVRSRRFRGDHVLLGIGVTGAPDLEVEGRGPALPSVGQAVRVRVDADAVAIIAPDPGPSVPEAPAAPAARVG